MLTVGQLATDSSSFTVMVWHTVAAVMAWGVAASAKEDTFILVPLKRSAR